MREDINNRDFNILVVCEIVLVVFFLIDIVYNIYGK